MSVAMGLETGIQVAITYFLRRKGEKQILRPEPVGAQSMESSFSQSMELQDMHCNIKLVLLQPYPCLQGITDCDLFPGVRVRHNLPD